MIHVEHPGPGVCVVGLPVYGRRHFGVPPGGAADLLSLIKANRLLGNADDCPALEVFARSLRLFSDEALEFAVIGSTADGMFKGRSLFVEGPRQGRFYVAVRDGFPHLLGSETTLSPRGRGSDDVRGEGDQTYLIASSQILIIPGPEATPEILAKLIQTQFRISPYSNRMGVRLTGATLPVLPEMRSSPTDVGTIQLPPSGEPIILGWDGPTIGGYPRIASVIRRDLRNVGQLCPGDTVSFELA